MRAKIGVLATWAILVLGCLATISLQSRLLLSLTPLAALLARRAAGIRPISRPGDKRRDIVVVSVVLFVLLCMWVDLLFHVPGWLRSGAQFAFGTLVIVLFLIAVYRDFQILIAPAEKKSA